MRWTRLLVLALMGGALTGCISSLYEVEPERPWVVVDQQCREIPQPCRRCP
jgi:hypothetical protein